MKTKPDRRSGEADGSRRLSWAADTSYLPDAKSLHHPEHHAPRATSPSSWSAPRVPRDFLASQGVSGSPYAHLLSA